MSLKGDWRRERDSNIRFGLVSGVKPLPPPRRPQSALSLARVAVCHVNLRNNLRRLNAVDLKVLRRPVPTQI
jgi:hypothetical protein